MNDACHCDSGKLFAVCCEPLLLGKRKADNPVALMRSRYSAFVTHNRDYLLASWHPEYRPQALDLSPEQKWLGLKVRDFGIYEPSLSGWVDFVARYKIEGKGYRLEERSLFSTIDGCWYYEKPDPEEA